VQVVAETFKPYIMEAQEPPEWWSVFEGEPPCYKKDLC
jgi:hypothetical protein